MSRTLPAINGRLIGLVLLAGAVVALAWAYLGGEHGTFAEINGVPRNARAAAPPAVTATATPLTCETYNVLTATATIVPGSFDIGNHCDDCVTTITLPFPAQLYGQSFTSANISSNGDLYFGTGNAGVGDACQPTPGFTYAIFAFPDDLYTLNSGYGVFTSISGSAPNRIFNVEWRAQFFPGTGYVNFEIRLYEAQQGFDIIYGASTSNGAGALVQRDVTCYTSYCHTVYPGLLLAFGGPSPASPSPTPAPATATASPTACYYPNPIQNPGFETGQLAPWVIDGFNNPPAISTAQAHSGTYSVFVGSYYGPEPDGDSSLYQQVTVPPTDGTLTFWYWPCGDSGPISFDWQDAYVTDLNGNILATIMHIGDTESCMWLQRTFNMAPFAGQTVRIKFLVHEDGFGDVTFMYVDDVAILAPDCLTITPSPTSPPPTASPTGTPPLLTSTVTATDTITPQEGTATSTSLSISTATVTSTYTPAQPTATSCAIGFSDVPPGSTFYPFIRCLACRGIINGYPDGTFKPNANVTRGQLSKIVSNSAGFHDNQSVQMFQDVPAGSTFFQYIGRLASRGYISGYPCGDPNEPCIPPSNLPYFRPNSNATRGQISKIDANAAGFSDPPSGQQFQDVPPGSTYYTYAYRLATRDVMQGYQCGGVGEPCVPPANLPYFRPNNNATRGQTSKIVANTFFPDCQTPARR